MKRAVKESGAWDADASGRLIITNITGAFDATHALQVSASTKATATSLATAITIAKNGDYRFTVTNFSGSTDNRRIYGVDGKNRAFEFDGTTYVPIVSGLDTDTPEEITAHKLYLWLGKKSSSVISDAGNPYEFSTEIAGGDNITGYAQLSGEALAVLARNSSSQIVGTTVSNFVKNNISTEVGCISNTVQQLGYAFCLDDRGVIAIAPTEKYGNFEQNTLSRKVQPLINTIRPLVTTSVTYKNKNQYRLYGSDGSGVCMTVLNEGVAFMPFTYPDNIVCAVSGEDSSGNEIIYLGSDDGQVFQAEKGSSFDGEDIEAFLALAFNHSQSPSYIKSYLTASIEMKATRYSSISYYPVFSDGDPDIPEHTVKVIESSGGGSFWDIAYWDTFFYDGVSSSRPTINLYGDGINMSLTIYSKSSIDLGHTINGMIFQYIIRRLTR